MRINGLYYGNPYRLKNSETNTENHKQSIKKVAAPYTNRSNIAFGNRPWVLNPRDYGISNYGSITGNEAITLYSQLKLGNYLDIGDDKFDFDGCNRIREQNLDFLNRVNYSPDKQQFLKYFENLTGFPNLKQVSKNIKQTFLNALDKSQKELWGDNYNVILAGYDGVCSVGRGKAFPGSDLDKAYVILKGTNSDWEDNRTIGDFKGKLWINTDQRILSYNHDDASFPQVYTKRQIEELTHAVAKKDKGIDKFAFNAKLFTKIMKAVTFPVLYKRVLEDSYSEDYVKVNQYWIDRCRQFPKAGNDTINTFSPSRENIKNIGFTLEAIREGEILKGTKEAVNLSTIPYASVNLSQLAALKQRNDRKPKRLARDNMLQEFTKWDLDKQFRFIKALIKSACGNNKIFTTEFSQYFSKPSQDLFAPMIKAIMK